MRKIERCAKGSAATRSRDVTPAPTPHAASYILVCRHLLTNLLQLSHRCHGYVKTSTVVNEANFFSSLSHLILLPSSLLSFAYFHSFFFLNVLNFLLFLYLFFPLFSCLLPLLFISLGHVTSFSFYSLLSLFSFISSSSFFLSPYYYSFSSLYSSFLVSSSLIESLLLPFLCLSHFIESFYLYIFLYLTISLLFLSLPNVVVFCSLSAIPA